MCEFEFRPCRLGGFFLEFVHPVFECREADRFPLAELTLREVAQAIGLDQLDPCVFGFS